MSRGSFPRFHPQVFGFHASTTSKRRKQEAGSRKPGVLMTNKSRHAGLGIAMGTALGAVFGVLAGNMGVWLAVGVAIGLFIGLSVPRRQKDCPQCAQVHLNHDHRAHGMRDPRQQASS
jgi:hypothetical protein